METIEELAERIEAALPADVVDREIALPNGAILRLVRLRVPGTYCDTCGGDLVLAGHINTCPELAVEREQARLTARAKEA